MFKIIEQNEMGFKRSADNPDNLIYTAQVSLMNALDSKSISIVNSYLFSEIVKWRNYPTSF